MAQLTHTEFEVNDEGGGANLRVFRFDTTTQGSDIIVTTTFEGSGPIEVKLNENQCKAQINSNGARVMVTGEFTLSWDASNATKLIVFSGTLHTTHSTNLRNVCIGAID